MMETKEGVKIDDARLSEDGRRVENNILVSESWKSQFIEDPVFFAEYDVDVSDVPLGILNVPALSTIIHHAWARGYDVEVGEIDRTYLEGIEEARAFMKEHPSFEFLPFDTTVTPKKVADNQAGGSRKGLLFSGGCDSTSSYVAFREENPELIMIWGLDVMLGWPDFWNIIQKKYAWMKPRTIRTNTQEIGSRQFTNGLGKYIREGYRGGYSYSINTLGVCAPLTFAEGIGELMLSSTYPSTEYGGPHLWSADRPNFIIDEYMSWGDVKTMNVLDEYTTNEKVKHFLKPYFEEHGPLFLRSCGHRALLKKHDLKRLNCCECDKCARVIGMLIVNDIDPATCGFPVNENVYERIKNYIMLKNHKWFRLNPQYVKYHWSEIKANIPDKIERDFKGSRRFLNWLRKYQW